MDRAQGVINHCIDLLGGHLTHPSNSSSARGRSRERAVAACAREGYRETAVVLDAHVMLFGGGVVIRLGDEVIGSIGASGAPGAKLGDGCTQAGLDKIRDQL